MLGDKYNIYVSKTNLVMDKINALLKSELNSNFISTYTINGEISFENLDFYSTRNLETTD